MPLQAPADLTVEERAQARLHEREHRTVRVARLAPHEPRLVAEGGSKPCDAALDQKRTLGVCRSTEAMGVEGLADLTVNHIDDQMPRSTAVSLSSKSMPYFASRCSRMNVL